MSQMLKDAAARLGFHVVRNYQNPSHTLMGLRGLGITCVLDVGANSGQFARAMIQQLPQADFHCFEPTPAAYAALAEWAVTQPRVNAVQLALGEHPGNLQMNLHTAHSTSSSLLQTSEHCQALYPFTVAQRKIDVSVQRLDDYVAALPAPLGTTLLKLDVQGFEAQVLRGAPRVLGQASACIVEVSLDELYVGQSGFDEIVALTTAAGLRYAGNFQQMYGADGHVISLDAVFVRSPSSI